MQDCAGRVGGQDVYSHILIATDGSELAGRGVTHGLALAQKLGATVTLLSVVEPLSGNAVRMASLGGIDDPVVRYDQQIDLMMRERFAAIEREAGQYGVTVNMVHEIDDSPAQAIVRTARLQGCDLIVMASHGRRGIRRALLGSQTSEVLVDTAIPVLVIR
jgi:nucleotide-binding universal stress UspA family protein